MKKKMIQIIVMICLYALCGCSTNKSLNPNQILTNSGKTLTIYDTKSMIDNALGKQGDNYFVAMWDYGDLKVAHSKYRVDNQLIVVSFLIDNPNYKTYSNVSVGDTWADAINKLNKTTQLNIEDCFSTSSNNDIETHTLIFDNDRIISRDQQINTEDDWLIIDYTIEDNLITRIFIRDVRFNKMAI